MTISEISKLLKERKISTIEVLEIFMRQSDSLENELNVWVSMDRDLVSKSALKCEKQMASGKYRGPLHGIPIGIKDIYFTEDMKTTCCSPIYEDYQSDDDAEVVQLLREAGSIIMGKTVTTQFACGDPPQTRNPWNYAKTPGGSSSGSAVGVAAGYFPASIGSQTAGSVLRPAAYNGIVGLKPTYGLVSRYGQYPVSPSLDTVGWFTRTVEDSAILLQCLAGYDHRDKGSVYSNIPKYEINSKGNYPPKIGLINQYYANKSDPHTSKTIDALAAKFESEGANVDQFSIKVSFEELLMQHGIIMATEASNTHMDNYSKRANDYSPKVKDLIVKGMRTSNEEYKSAKRTQLTLNQIAEQAFTKFDVLMCPTAVSGAPSTATTGQPSFQAIWTMAGTPSISLPYALDNEGLPLGAQIIGRNFGEHQLLSVAHWMEKVIGFNGNPSS